MKNLNILLALLALGSLPACTVNYYGVGPGAPTNGPHRNVRQANGSWSTEPYDPNYPGGPTTVIVQPNVVGAPSGGYPSGPGTYTPPPPVRGGSGQWNGGNHSPNYGGGTTSSPGSHTPPNGTIRNPQGLENAPVRHTPPPVGLGNSPASPNTNPGDLENAPVRPTRQGGSGSTGLESTPNTPTNPSGLENAPVRPTRNGTIDTGGLGEAPGGAAPTAGPGRTIRTGGIKPMRGTMAPPRNTRNEETQPETPNGATPPADAPVENAPVRTTRRGRSEAPADLETAPTPPASAPQDRERR